jgi:hypothetical protein
MSASPKTLSGTNEWNSMPPSDLKKAIAPLWPRRGCSHGRGLGKRPYSHWTSSARQTMMTWTSPRPNAAYTCSTVCTGVMAGFFLTMRETVERQAPHPRIPPEAFSHTVVVSGVRAGRPFELRARLETLSSNRHLA